MSIRTIATADGTLTVERKVIGATATAVATAADGDRELIFINNSAAVMDIGDSSVAPGNGIPLQPNGGSWKVTASSGSKGAWYAAYAGGGGDLCVVGLR